MKLSKSNQDKLIGGIITVLILVTTLFVQKCFDKRKPKQIPQKTEIVSSNIAIANDSSTLNLAKTNQENLNKGDVTNEYIFGEKNVYQNQPLQVKEKPALKKVSSNKSNPFTKPTTQIEKIDNNGNLSIGQTGGIVNQTTFTTQKPLPRHINENDSKFLKDSIPLSYTVDVYNSFSNKESEYFALEMLNLLNQLGYKTTHSQYGQIVPDLEQSYFLKVNHLNRTAQITIYRLK